MDPLLLKESMAFEMVPERTTTWRASQRSYVIVRVLLMVISLVDLDVTVSHD